MLCMNVKGMNQRMCEVYNEYVQCPEIINQTIYVTDCEVSHNERRPAHIGLQDTSANMMYNTSERTN